MIDIIKDLFKKCSLPIPILYITIITFYMSLCLYDHNTYVVDLLTNKLFNSYENLCFMNFFVKNLIIIFCVIYLILIILNALINHLNLKLIIFKMQSIILYLSAFKLFTYFLINYKRSPDENINVILVSSGSVVIPLLFVIIIFGVVEWKINKI
ncbi:MAG: hypothetical protein BHV95_02450 [Clostridiales bacterium Nov_37_41]|nr:MAG: hypothetical protein BHV95_02450 [Clostridiales bacterium Nov_37_41]SCJ20885.1 Uncharacterised protein [uncultured Ruminococcus sp.]